MEQKMQDRNLYLFSLIGLMIILLLALVQCDYFKSQQNNEAVPTPLTTSNGNGISNHSIPPSPTPDSAQELSTVSSGRLENENRRAQTNIQDTRIQNSFSTSLNAQQLLQKGREYLNSGYFGEAIECFIEVQVNNDDQNLAKLAAIEHGIALLKRAQAKRSTEDLNLSRSKLEQIINEHQSYITAHPEEFSHFLTLYCLTSIMFDTPDYNLRNSLSSIRSRVDENAKQHITAYLGFLEYYSNHYRRAMEYFQTSSVDLAELGKLKTYLATGHYQRARFLCSDFIRYRRNSDLLDKVLQICSDHFRCIPSYPEDCSYFRAGQYSHYQCCQGEVGLAYQVTRTSANGIDFSPCCPYYIVAGRYLERHRAQNRINYLNSIQYEVPFIIGTNPNHPGYYLVSRRNYSGDELDWALVQLYHNNLDVYILPDDPECACR